MLSILSQVLVLQASSVEHADILMAFCKSNLSFLSTNFSLFHCLHANKKLIYDPAV